MLPLSFSLFAQTPSIEVTGQITDGTSPIPGATVLIKGEQRGTVSDFNGHYKITAQPTDTLAISYIGYATVEEPVSNRTSINIQMKEDATTLREVVINAGYYSTTDRERTGSIAQVTAKDIEKQPVTNPLAAMQGRMAGVAISQTTGAPGGGFDIQIRGVNSLRAAGNDPLYIVDGVPFSSQSLGDIQTSGGIFAGVSSPLNSINSADIESIEVLKDADATAIYGSKGANGVVLIKTKRGKEGKTRVSINSYSGIGNVTRTMNMMNTQQYLAMRREAFENDGITVLPPNAYDVNGTWDENRYTDWQKELIGGTAYFNNLQAGLSGGSAGTQYLLSGTYRRETTVFPGEDAYDKIAIHSNVTHRSHDDRFNLSLSVNYAFDKNSIMANDLTSQAYRLVPNAPALYDENGELNWEGGTFENPLAASNGRYQNLTANLIANSVIAYKVLPNLELKTNLGYSDTRLKESRTLPSSIYNPVYGVTPASAILMLNHGDRSSWIVEPQLNWTRPWGDHKLDVLLGTTFQSQKSNRLSQMGMGFASDHLTHSLGAASTVQVTGDQMTEYNYQAVFGRINYNFAGKYILNLTGRRDGSSRFGPGNRFANFGALGAAWLFTNEQWMQGQASWLSFGKLRGSYGTTGSDQIGDYQFMDTYFNSGNLYNGVTGLQPTRLFNPNFGWETNKKLEFAAELGFVQDRVFLTAAWYQNRSSNQLVGIPLPATTGFSSVQANLDAVIQNTGFETELRTVNIRNTNFSWVTTFNSTVPKNKLLRFEGLEGSTYANAYEIGESVNILKLYSYVGIDPETGTYLFEDFDGDGQISSTDRQHIQDLSQKWFGGLGNQISYKNWGLDFLFQFVKQEGRNYLSLIGIPGAMLNMPVAATNHWPANTIDPEIQSYTTGANGAALNAYFRYRDSNAAFSDASFIRLKNINLSYKLPAEGFKNISGTVYLQGQNLLTFTKYRGADPENQSFSYLPPLRQWALGLQLNF